MLTSPIKVEKRNKNVEILSLPPLSPRGNSSNQISPLPLLSPKGSQSGPSFALTSPNGKPLPLVPPIKGTEQYVASSSSSTQSEYVRVNVSEEDMLLAMLGYKDLNRSIGPDGEIYFREEFCGACGIIHANPEVLDTYYNCKACHCVIREPSALRLKYRRVKAEAVLEIIFATYGDPYDPAGAYDVTAKVIERMREFQSMDRLVFRPRDQMDQIFGRDPSPGKNKQLRVRYRMNGLHATLVLDFNVENKIPVPFLLLAPKKQFLRIHSAMYGHPAGATKTGRMCFDVSEILQSFIDQNGGSYLLISAYTPLYRLLGDPCPGYTKDLRIEFEIVGRSGQLIYSEIRGHLTKRLMLQTSPCVAPILYIQSAFYGITPSSRKDRLDFIAKQLKRIDMIDHRRVQGLPVQPEDILFLRNRGLLLEQRTIYQNAPTKFIDVSEKLQRLADKGRYQLHLDKDSFDPNMVFGNPSPGHPKILEVLIDCQGHDSERLTDSVEMMDTGFTRNFITVKKNRFNIPVNDFPIYGQNDDMDNKVPNNDEKLKRHQQLKYQGIRASANIGGLQMMSIDDPLSFSTSQELLKNTPSIESMLSFSKPNISASAKGKKSSSRDKKQIVENDQGRDSAVNRRPFADLPVPGTNAPIGGRIRGSLDMGLFGDDLIGDAETEAVQEVVVNDAERPDKPQVLGGLLGGGNTGIGNNHRHEQLLALQELQQNYRAKYGDMEDKERLEATANTNRPIIGYKGVLQESLNFQTNYVAPLIIVKRATYGELRDLNNCIDVTRDIQYMVKGRVLDITREVNLNEVFHKDPSPGRRKQLKIEYIMRGFRGNLRVREKNDCVVANVELGYPPLPPPDDENHIAYDS